MQLQPDQADHDSQHGARQNVGDVMHAHRDARQRDERRPDPEEQCHPGGSQSGSEDGNEECARGVTGREGVRVGVAIDAAPFPFRPASADKEFDAKHDRGQHPDPEKLHRFPTFPQ